MRWARERDRRDVDLLALPVTVSDDVLVNWFPLWMSSASERRSSTSEMGRGTWIPILMMPVSDVEVCRFWKLTILVGLGQMIGVSWVDVSDVLSGEGGVDGSGMWLARQMSSSDLVRLPE